MEKNIILKKTQDFKTRIIELEKYLIDTHSERVLSAQILDTAFKIEQNIMLAVQSSQISDFISSVHKALNQTYDMKYWLELLFEADYISEETFISVEFDYEELISIYIECENSKQ